jgi:histidine phosphotransferase ChpT
MRNPIPQKARLMHDEHTDIAATISARICHDLISPIGAISNGVELLELSGAQQSPELALISESVKSANAKVRFLRIAFGDASGGCPIAFSEINDILATTYNTTSLKLLWAINAPVDRRELKLCFLILLCIEKIQPYGGTLNVTRTGTDIRFDIAGRDLKTDAFWDGQTLRIDPRSGPSFVQFNLAQIMLDDLGYTLHMGNNGNAISILIQT